MSTRIYATINARLAECLVILDELVRCADAEHAAETTLYADEAAAWNALHARYELHSGADDCTCRAKRPRQRKRARPVVLRVRARQWRGSKTCGERDQKHNSADKYGRTSWR
jgi:hypothetical protein